MQKFDFGAFGISAVRAKFYWKHIKFSFILPILPATNYNVDHLRFIAARS